MASPYTQVKRVPLERVVLMMPKTEVVRLDRWGISTKHPSRSAAIRTLIAQGIAAPEGGAQTTAGNSLTGTDPAVVSNTAALPGGNANTHG